MGLDRIGTFRCIPLEWGVSLTSQKNLPQFVVRVKLMEYYDQQEDTWFDYSEFDAEINTYLCLYGADKKKNDKIGPTLSYDQVKKVFSWDGKSFATLSNGDYSELQFQVRIGDNTWEGARSPYQVDWIDEYDVDPARQLRKLDAAELKDLDKQFAALNKEPVKAVTVPHPAKVPTDDKKTEKPVTTAEKKKIMKARSNKIKAAAAAETKAKEETEINSTDMPGPPEAEDPLEAPADASAKAPAENACDKQQAWEAIVEMRDPTINDETIKELWNAAIEEIAGPEAITKVGQKKITDEQWYQVKEIVLKDCAKF